MYYKVGDKVNIRPEYRQWYEENIRGSAWFLGDDLNGFIVRMPLTFNPNLISVEKNGRGVSIPPEFLTRAK